MDGQNSYRAGPDDKGRFGHYGGRFVAETLMPLILDLEAAIKRRKQTPLSRLSWSICKRIMSVGPVRYISPSGSLSILAVQKFI